MKVHADILKLAKTTEQRERIKWFHARTVFFRSDLRHGLELARTSQHQDARRLVSLFPEGPPMSWSQAGDVFRLQGEDPLCLAWAAECGLADDRTTELLRRSAEGGCAWGQCRFAERLTGADRVMWLTESAAREEPEAMWRLASLIWDGWDVAKDKEEAKRLYLEAALLGNRLAQCAVAEHCCPRYSNEHYVWLRRSAIQRGFGHGSAVGMLMRAVGLEMYLYEQSGDGRNLFEIGAALAEVDHWSGFQENEVSNGHKARMLYTQWCAAARRAVLCWLWLARDQKVAKDIRLVIADLIWSHRRSWCVK